MLDGIGAVIHDALPGAGERLRFLELCAPCSAEDLSAAADRLTGHMDRIEAHAADDPTIDAPAARRIGTALLALIAGRHRLEHEERRLLLGAIEYFVLAGDDSDDFRELSGIDDDARVARAVCRALDRADLAATI